jgi:hypothetical protein
MEDRSILVGGREARHHHAAGGAEDHLTAPVSEAIDVLAVGRETHVAAVEEERPRAVGDPSVDKQGNAVRARRGARASSGRVRKGSLAKSVRLGAYLRRGDYP